MRTWSLPLLCQVLRLARGALHILAAAASAAFKSRATLHLENLALRHQLGVLRRSVKRPSLTSADRLLWEWLCGVWSDWRSALVIVKPETVIGWHRKGFRLYWTWKVRHGRPGRPPISNEVRKLIRTMPRESAVGRAPHPRRIAQTRHRYRRDQASASTSCAVRSRRRKTGGHSWRITSRPWCRQTSSPSRPSGFRSCTCSWFWLMTKGGSCIST